MIPTDNPKFEVYFHQPVHSEWLSYNSKPIVFYSTWCPPFLLRLITKIINALFSTDQVNKELTINKVSIDQDHVAKAICKSQELMSQIYNRRCRAVIVGPRQLRNFYQEMPPYEFATQIRIGGNHGINFYGVRIIVVPWFDGCLGLPHDVELKNLSQDHY